MTPVSSFLYRLPRFTIHFPVEFVTATGITAGRALNLSHTGLLATFHYPLPLETAGLLRLRPADRSFELTATVSHVEGLRAGLHFLFSNSQQEQVIRALVEAIALHTSTTP